MMITVNTSMQQFPQDILCLYCRFDVTVLLFFNHFLLYYPRPLLLFPFWVINILYTSVYNVSGDISARQAVGWSTLITSMLRETAKRLRYAAPARHRCQVSSPWPVRRTRAAVKFKPQFPNAWRAPHHGALRFISLTFAVTFLKLWHNFAGIM